METTTGPLGQGVATSVGMAIAGGWMAGYFNRPGLEMFDYDPYALCGDGDIMEGGAGEAASLAGHLKLSNLCWIYDNNRITIEGNTSLAFSEDVATRFLRSYRATADRRVATALALPERADVFVLERLRLVDGEPVSFQASCLCRSRPRKSPRR